MDVLSELWSSGRDRKILRWNLDRKEPFSIFKLSDQVNCYLYYLI